MCSLLDFSRIRSLGVLAVNVKNPIPLTLVSAQPAPDPVTSHCADELRFRQALFSPFICAGCSAISSGCSEVASHRAHAACPRIPLLPALMAGADVSVQPNLKNLELEEKNVFQSSRQLLH